MAEEKKQQNTRNATKTASAATGIAATWVTRAALLATGVGEAIGPLLEPLARAIGALVSKITREVSKYIKKHPIAAGIAAGGFVLPALLAGTTGAVALTTPLLVAGGVFFISAIFGGVILGAVFAGFMAAFLGFIIFLAITIFIINSGAYLVPPAPQLGSSIGNLPPGSTAISNPYIEVTKIADPPGPFQNGAVPNPITYTITIKAKQGALINPRFDNKCNVLTARSNSTSDVIRETNPICPAPIPIGNTPQTIDPGSSGYTFKYTADYTSSAFTDALVTDTFTVTATVEGVSDQTAAATAGIVIGNPPAQCPNGWPILPQGSERFLSIIQGPYGLYSHSRIEAIDVVASIGHSITARNSGTVTAYNTPADAYGKHVVISSVCNGKKYNTIFGHLDIISVRTGTTVSLGTIIGYSGNNGHSDIPHLHYEFSPPLPNVAVPMSQPFIPKNVKKYCYYLNPCDATVP
ncbi:peptidoglycan DD-metalloendopeptidase family protein [Candidatus Woesebacteria bacterium]|nr:peptidoglycan DD-metalloendopeptidase family protein [Candidatus Woesebacteria bacterium]QQG47652.1 MAG: peptidoglycan DD-metalloendopeptidase family protein [Candidatus Woesebacteria bacterium]